MDQVVVLVYSPPPNKHINIKNVANSHVGVTLKRRQKRSKIYVLLLLHLLPRRHTFIVQAVSRELLQTPA